MELFEQGPPVLICAPMVNWMNSSIIDDSENRPDDSFGD